MAAEVTCLTATTVFNLDPIKKEVTCVSERGPETFQAKAILMATGCRESTRSALMIPGFRGQGILSTNEAQQYIHDLGVLPGKRVVILGSEDVGLSAVYALGKTDARVVGMVEEHSHLVGSRLFSLPTIVLRRVPLYTWHKINLILGNSSVEGVEIIALDQNGDPLPGTERTIACDTVVVSGKFVPENALPRQSGISLDERTSGPVVDQYLQTEIPGVFASGNLLRGVETGDIAALEGEWAAHSIQKYLQDSSTLTGHRVIVTAGEQVKWIMPQRFLSDASESPGFLATLRVNKRIRHGQIICGSDGEIWRSGKFRLLKPERRIRLNLHKWPKQILQESVELAIVT